MVLLPTGVLFFSAFINNTLFVKVDPSVIEVFVCLSQDNVYNDSWPSSWKPMNVIHLLSIDNELYSYKIDKTTINDLSYIRYKIRLHFKDKTHAASEEWNLLYAKPCIENYILHICVTVFTLFLLFFICILCYILYNVYMCYK